MRDIIFRGKRSYDKKWVYGSFVKIDNKCHIIQDEDIEENGHHFMQVSDNPTWVDEETIGQFSGLTDKNGKEIWEGDIIQHGYISYQYAIEYINSGFMCCKRHGEVCFSLFEADLHKVIGNIHDNPELLTENNQTL